MTDDDASVTGLAPDSPPSESTPSHARTAPWMRRKTDRIRTWNPAGDQTPDTEPLRPLQLSPSSLHPPVQGAASTASTASTATTTASPSPAPIGRPPPRADSDSAPTGEGSALESSDPLPPSAPSPSVDLELVATLQARIDALEEELEATRKRSHRAVERLARGAFELSLRVDQDVVRLGRRLAEAVIRRSVHLDDSVIVGTLRAAFGLSGPLEKVTVRCSEHDAPLLRKASEDLATELMGRWVEVAVQPSPDIAPGGLILLFDEGVVDARIPTQLDRLTEVVERAVGAQSFDASDQEELAQQALPIPEEPPLKGPARVDAGAPTAPDQAHRSVDDPVHEPAEPEVGERARTVPNPVDEQAQPSPSSPSSPPSNDKEEEG